MCRMDAGLWKISSAVKQVPGALESAKGPCSVKLPRNGPQRVRASAQTLKRVCNLRVWNVGYRIPSQLQMRCNATPEGSDGVSKVSSFDGRRKSRLHSKSSTNISYKAQGSLKLEITGPWKRMFLASSSSSPDECCNSQDST